MTDLHYARTLYIDVEQCCWEGPAPDGLANDIIQIGLVEVDTLALAIRRSRSYMVRPKKFEISTYCTNLTGITFEQVKQEGRPLNEITNNIIKEFGPKNKMCFAWGDDDSIIRQNCIDVNASNPFGRTIIDLGIMFRSTYLLKHNMALKNALQYLHIPFEGRAHDALVDASNLARLHCEMLRLTRAAKDVATQNL